jgi:hypothetical protein
MCFDAIGLVAQCLEELVRRLVALPGRGQSDAERAMHLGRAPTLAKGERPACVGRGLLQMAQPELGDAEEVAKIGIVGMARSGTADVVGGVGIMAGLQRHGAQEAEARRVGGRQRQEPLANADGLAQPAALVALHGLGQGLVDHLLGEH